MKVTLNYSENLHFIATARNFKGIELDEPESFHGSDLGPSPVEYLLIGIGGCLGSTFAYCLQRKNIPIEDMQVIVDGELKHAGPKLRLKLTKVDSRITFKVKKNTSSEIINYCINNFQEHCIVSNSIQDITINVEIFQNK